MKREDFINYAKENNLSQQKLGELIGVPQVTMWKYLNGAVTQPSLKTMKKLTDFYNKYIKLPVGVDVSLPAEPEEIFTEPVVTYKPKTQKVYLESVEDVIAELQGDNEIFVESSTGHSIKLVSGFVVRYKDGGAISINAPILCSERYYVIKPIPLTLQVGKRYRAKNGSIVTIFNVDGCEFMGVVDGKQGFVEFDPKGLHHYNHEFDLVEEL